MIALVTAATAIDLDTDLALLTRELTDAEVVVWDDPSVDWSRFDAVIIRSTWDYHECRAEFLDWARHVSDVSRLWNPLDLIVWNTDKRYLAEFAAARIPVTPTWFVARDELVPDDVPAESDLVVKPSVGANSSGVVRTRGDETVLAGHVRRLHAAGLDALVQPYLAGVEQAGETGLVYLGGAFSHAIERRRVLDGPARESSQPRAPSAAQLALGDRVVDQLSETAYARIDLLPSAEGPVVLEVELTEPSLFLECDPDAAARAAAVFRSLTA